MPKIDLSMLNQRQTPAFYADVLANRPAAGFVGRIFVSTDTYAFYRDNGTSWDLIGGPGTGTITGSGANGQVSYWNGASTITGSNDLFFDSVNGHLGIGTITPGTALSIDHDQNTLIQLQQTVATNDTRIAFINNGVGLWRLGAFYNAGANDFALYNVITGSTSLKIDVANNITAIGAYQSDKASTVGGTPQFVLKNGSNGTRSVLGLIGTEGTNTGSDTFLYNYLDNGTAVPVFRTTRATGNIDFSFSGSFGSKLTVTSATGDNHIQIVGATAPSLRIDNAGTSATKRAGLGISTATNNFIQGSVDRDFCVFNSSTTASPILFGIYDAGLTNTQEAARISPARNFIVGSSVDAGNRFQCVGSALITGATTITNSLTINSLLVGGSTSFTKAYIADTLTATTIGTNYNPGILNLQNLSATNGNLSLIGFQDASAFINLAAFGAINEVHSGSPNNVVGSLAFYTKPAGSQYLIERVRINSLGVTTFRNNINVGDTTSSADALTTYQNSLNGFQFGLATTGTQRFIFINGGAAECANINGTTGVYTAVSDINKKKNFEESNLGLDAVLKLKPTLYNMISQDNSEPKELGLIAQEVKDVISQAYVQCDDFIGINYNPIIVTLVKAIQELNTKIENLKN